MRLIGPRVILRQWDDVDLPAFAAMNADKHVMEFFPKKLSRKESREVFAILKDEIEDRGWGKWAVEINGDLAGYTGLARPSFEAHFTPCTEIGWRFRPQFWGQGYATEAARVALLFAFFTLRLEEVVSFTAGVNLRSVKVMQRLGMMHDPQEDFDRPKLPAGNVVQRHMLYRLRNTPDTVARLKTELGIQVNERERVG